MKRKPASPTAAVAVVVNDDPTQLSMLSALVLKAGLSPSPFTDAEAALADMAANANTLPSIIITDLYMPGIDGWRFCRLLRSPEYATLNHIPILVVSATFVGAEPDRIATDLGAETFLSSPVDGKLFVKQVQAIVNKRQIQKTLRVLIVEDTKTLAGMLKKAFNANCYEADTALTFRAAADAFSKTAYDVAVLDYHLPDGKGDTLLEDFHATQPDCVCIMMTIDPSPGLALEWMKRGAAAYLRKPFKPEYLIELCSKARRERGLLRVQDLLEVRTRELRESEERYRGVFAATPDGIIVHDAKGLILDANEAMAKRLESSVHALQGRFIAEFITPESAAGIADNAQMTLAGQTHVFETNYISASGRMIPAEVHESRIQWMNKQAILSISRDITKHKMAQDALQYSEERFRSMIQSLSDIILIIDANGQITYESPAAMRILGYSPGYFIGKSPLVHIHPDDLDRIMNDLHEVIGSVTPGTSTEFRYRKVDGSWINFEAMGSNQIDNPGIHGIILTIRDISDRKQAEETYRNIFRNSQIGLFRTEISTGLLLDANDAVAEFFGFSDRVSLLAKPFSIPERYVDPDDQQKMISLLKKRSDFKNFEARFRKNDGSIIWMRFSARHVKEKGWLEGVAEEITEQRLSREALKQSEAQYRLLADHTTDQVWLMDMNLKATYISPSAKKSRGYTFEETAQIPLKKQLTPTSFQLAMEFFAREMPKILADPTYVVPALELEFYRKDGSTLWIENAFSLILDENGKPLSILGEGRDITERKRIQEALRASEEKYRWVIDNMADVITVIDMNLCVTYVSPSIMRLRGYTAEEATAQTFEQFMTPESLQIATQAFEEEMKLEATGTADLARSRILELEQYRKDGSTVWMEVSMSFMRDEAHKPVGIISVSRDITDRKRNQEDKTKLEAQLQQAQKMESVGRLAGGVAHDFNNMLSVIQGYSELAIKKAGADNPVQRHLAQILDAARRSAALTRQLLAFARKQTIAPIVLDLNKTIESMLKMLQRLIGENIELQWHPKVDLWPVKIDPSQIDQILANLCVNARDAIADVGKIVIATENITLDKDYCANHPGCIPGDYLRLTISDNGCGMDKETQDILFEPFFTTKEMGKGTGLGLATVYGIVKQNNGFINVQSEPGQGTSFTIYLLRYTAEAGQTMTAGHSVSASGGHETILLVEDEPAILEMATTMLEGQGYTVRAAATPGEAMRLAREHKGQIDLLVTDVVMPGMNGRDLAKTLLSLYPRLKRLFMSGYTANVIAHRGVLDEGVYFIQKPFSIDELSTKVRESLDGNENPV